MDIEIEERLKMLPPDGEMKICTERKKGFKSNIMIIKCPNHLLGPNDPMFQFATVDRSIPGTVYSGDRIIDKLCPGLGKVTLLEEEPPEILPDSPPETPPPPPKKYAPQRSTYATRRGNRYVSGGRARSYHKKPQQRSDKSWAERTDKAWKCPGFVTNEKSRIDRHDKSWVERPVRSNADEICPWEEGKQPWNNILGNIQVPVFSDRFGFGRLTDILPLPSDYPHTPVVFHRGASPTFKPPSKGLLGDRPYENDPGRSYMNHNPNSDPLNLNNTFPSVPRDSVIGKDYRNSNPRNPRGSFQSKNFFERKPFVNRKPFQNDERNSEASIWNGDEGARHSNKTRGQNRNRRGKPFNRRGQGYRPRRNNRN